LQEELPLTVRTLKLVSLVSTIVVLSITGSIAYSGYSEFQAIASDFQNSGNLGTISTNSTTIAISGITIPNKMSLPLILTLSASAFLSGNLSLATTTANTLTVEPGQTGIFNLGVRLNMTNIFAHQSQLRSILFNGTELSLNLELGAAVFPFVALNVSKALTQPTGAMLGGFRVQFNTAGATDNGTDLLLPLQMTWLSTSFMSASGSLSAKITQMPGQAPGGNYGSGSTNIAIAPGPGSATLTLVIPNFYVSGGTPPSGQYTISMTLYSFGQSLTFTETSSI
jgi:hypothetical protein